jgi:hypothetical protein
MFTWVCSVDSTQTLIAGVWAGDWGEPAGVSPINQLVLEQPDVISFHNCRPLPGMKRDVEALQHYGRPILCTECMTRSIGSTFDPVLGYLKSKHVGAYNWESIAGKTQTIYAWDSWH